MDAREHFQSVVVPSYSAFVRSPSDFHLLGNALVSMNTVAEYLGLIDVDTLPTFRAMSVVETRKRYVSLAVLQIYRHAPT